MANQEVIGKELIIAKEFSSTALKASGEDKKIETAPIPPSEIYAKRARKFFVSLLYLLGFDYLHIKADMSRAQVGRLVYFETFAFNVDPYLSLTKTERNIIGSSLSAVTGKSSLYNSWEKIRAKTRASQLFNFCSWPLMFITLLEVRLYKWIDSVGHGYTEKEKADKRIKNFETSGPHKAAKVFIALLFFPVKCPLRIARAAVTGVTVIPYVVRHIYRKIKNKVLSASQEVSPMLKNENKFSDYHLYINECLINIEKIKSHSEDAHKKIETELNNLSEIHVNIRRDKAFNQNDPSFQEVEKAFKQAKTKWIAKQAEIISLNRNLENNAGGYSYVDMLRKFKEGVLEDYLFNASSENEKYQALVGEAKKDINNEKYQQLKSDVELLTQDQEEGSSAGPATPKSITTSLAACLWRVKQVETKAAELTRSMKKNS